MSAPSLPIRSPIHVPYRRLMVLAFLLIFVLPLLLRAVMFAIDGGAHSWRDVDWSSSRMLPPAKLSPQARVLVFSGRTGGWKGVVAVHSWIVLKPANAPHWTRYDVVGWGTPLRENGWAPDGQWFGHKPQVVVDVVGKQADALLPKMVAAIETYRYRHPGDYRIWPGPNSNTFVATVLRAVPEIRAALPPNAVGRDYRPYPYFGLTGTHTGIEADLWGLFGVKLGWIEGFEINIAGLVAGFDLRRPALKLPGFGRIEIGRDLVPALPKPRDAAGEAAMKTHGKLSQEPRS